MDCVLTSLNNKRHFIYLFPCWIWAPSLQMRLVEVIWFSLSCHCQTGRVESGRYFKKSRRLLFIVVSVLWDLTLIFAASQRTVRQAINLWGKKKCRFRRPWKQPHRHESNGFLLRVPIFFNLNGNQRTGSWRENWNLKFILNWDPYSVLSKSVSLIQLSKCLI